MGTSAARLLSKALQACLLLVGPVLLNPSSIAYANYSLGLRVGGGQASYQAKTRQRTRGMRHGGLAFRVCSPDESICSGLDLTSYQLDNPTLGQLRKKSDGNDARLLLAWHQEAYHVWYAQGAGEIRIADREQTDDPRGFRTESREIGFSYDFYRAEFAKLELVTSFQQILPEKRWQRYYNLRMIEAWHIQVGLKLLDFPTNTAQGM